MAVARGKPQVQAVFTTVPVMSTGKRITSPDELSATAKAMPVVPISAPIALMLPVGVKLIDALPSPSA